MLVFYEGYQDELEWLQDQYQTINQNYQDEKGRVNSYTADSLKQFFPRGYR